MVFVRRLIGQEGEPRRGERDGDRAGLAAIVEVADVIGVVAHDEPPIVRRVGLVDRGERLHVGEGLGRPARAVGGTVERREVGEQARLVEHRRETTRVRGRAILVRVGIIMVLVGVLGHAEAELLEVEDAARLVHLLSGAVDGRHQREEPGDQDASGDGDVGPAKRDADRREVEQGPPRAAPLDDPGHRARRQAVGRLVRLAVVEELVERPAQAGEPLGQGGIAGDLPVEALALRAVETSEGVVKHL